MSDETTIPELPPTPEGAGGLWVMDDTTKQLKPVPVTAPVTPPAQPDATPSEESDA